VDNTPIDAQKSVDNSMDLTRMLRSIASSERLQPCSSLRRFVLVGALCLLLDASTIKMQPAYATPHTSANHYKLYAHSRIVDWTEFSCFIKLINKENRSWNPKAKNGSHYGLGQMRSTWYRELDPYRQIDATLKYIDARYGSVCKAWEHHGKRNWY
jgi:hypothetical protein